MARKWLIKGTPKNLPDLEETCPIWLLTKATKTPRGTTIDVSNFLSEFMIQMGFSFLNIESIRWFTSTFVAICSDT